MSYYPTYPSNAQTLLAIMKAKLKLSLVMLVTLLVAPLIILFKLLNTVVAGDALFTGFAQALSLIPGKTGSYIRVAFYRYTLTLCRSDSVISFLVLFSQQDTEIESGVYIGPQCNIGKCCIGKNTLLGSSVHIMSGKNQHHIDDLKTPIKDQGGSFEKISIGEDCWVGNGALIMANIGNHCVIGAGSVVVDDILDYSIVGGNPAKVLKVRASLKPNT
jgi:virginiamycin A acetyltransferase